MGVQPHLIAFQMRVFFVVVIGVVFLVGRLFEEQREEQRQEDDLDRLREEDGRRERDEHRRDPLLAFLVLKHDAVERDDGHAGSDCQPEQHPSDDDAPPRQRVLLLLLLLLDDLLAFRLRRDVGRRLGALDAVLSKFDVAGGTRSIGVGVVQRRVGDERCRVLLSFPLEIENRFVVASTAEEHRLAVGCGLRGGRLLLLPHSLDGFADSRRVQFARTRLLEHEGDDEVHREHDQVAYESDVELHEGTFRRKVLTKLCSKIY